MEPVTQIRFQLDGATLDFARSVDALWQVSRES